jgi:large subunit ribosomal protein L20
MRVKRGNVARQKKKKVFKRNKGFTGAGKKLFKASANARAIKAGLKSYRDRRKKKRDFRALWIQRLGAALAPLVLSCSGFHRDLQRATLSLPPQRLSDLAVTDSAAFQKIVEKVKA